MRTRTKMTGEQVWQWIVTHSEQHGTVIVPDMTVAELETACGRGALSKARRYMERETQQGFGPTFPYAAAILDVAEAMQLQGWTTEMAEAYARDYWLPHYGNRLCHHVRKPGEEQPADKVCVKYPCVG